MLPPIESNRNSRDQSDLFSCNCWRTPEEQRGRTRSIIRTRVAAVSLRFIRQTSALTKRPDLLDGANSSGVHPLYELFVATPVKDSTRCCSRGNNKTREISRCNDLERGYPRMESFARWNRMDFGRDISSCAGIVNSHREIRKKCRFRRSFRLVSSIWSCQPRNNEEPKRVKKIIEFLSRLELIPNYESNFLRRG